MEFFSLLICLSWSLLSDIQNRCPFNELPELIKITEENTTWTQFDFHPGPHCSVSSKPESLQPDF